MGNPQKMLIHSVLSSCLRPSCTCTAFFKREQEHKLGQNIFEVAIRLSKCDSQNGKYYIESKLGIFNIFVVLSNRVLKLGICRKKIVNICFKKALIS